MADTLVPGFQGSIVPMSAQAAGATAASLIWNDDPRAREVIDPRDPIFAEALVDGLATAFARTPGVLQRMMTGAATAAEGLSVDPFQGLIEVIQNADDLAANEVRFALRAEYDKQQLLIVHNGERVTCHHVLPMTIPYLTTKADDADQKGRFGIGLKTLARISTRLAVHCPPYHFSAESLTIRRVSPEASLLDFYDPTQDTMLVIDLIAGFDGQSFRQWFEQWDEDGLLFLSNVQSFRWCSVNGATILHKGLSTTEWQDVDFERTHPSVAQIRRRFACGQNATWTVFSADVRVPTNLKRAHKAKPTFASVSIAIPQQTARSGLFVAFKTRVPMGLAISLDAQFDPTTARDALIDNPWNTWIVERCADVIVDVAVGLLASDPRQAWRTIPLSEEIIGTVANPWPQLAFAKAFERVQNEIGSDAKLVIGGISVPLIECAYEIDILSDLLDFDDIEVLSPSHKAVRLDVRDEGGRWRKVLDQIGVSQVVGMTELLNGFSHAAFDMKPEQWWVNAGDRLTNHQPAEKIFGVPCWRTQDKKAASCHPSGTTERPLIFGGSISPFAMKWNLFDQLHDIYGKSLPGKRVCGWLAREAAFTTAPNPETDLAAFAETYAAAPVEIRGEDLQEMRDRFASLSNERAGELGPRVGQALLLEGFTYKTGKKQTGKFAPSAAYLSRTLGGEHPNWPLAAGTLPGIAWLSAGYDEKLKTRPRSALSKQPDGTMSRGARKFLSLLGAASAPRLVKTGKQYGGGPTRTRELETLGAEHVEFDYTSPDMERVLSALPRLPKRERRPRSAALLLALSRYWKHMYAERVEVPAFHTARVYMHEKGTVTAAWLCHLQETACVAVGNGDLVEPASAVVKTAQTQTLYSSKSFICDIDEGDIDSEFASRLGLISAVRVSDLISHLEEIRDEDESANYDHVLQIYRTLAKFCQNASAWHGRVGDLWSTALHQRFSNGPGLILTSTGEWKKPQDLFSGKDIFHQPALFVPAGPAYADLWRVLRVEPPRLTDCASFCKTLAATPLTLSAEATLIDIYRHMETLLPEADRRPKERLRSLPLACFGQWTAARPVYFIENRELQSELHRVLPEYNFWTPPCDVRDLPSVTKALGVISLKPVLSVVADRELSREIGENRRSRFQRGVDHLSNELARNDASTREKLTISWDELRDIPLYIYDSPFEVEVREVQFGPSPMRVRMKALLSTDPIELHVWIDAIPLRDHCGHAIASLFSLEAQRGIEAEWVASWLGSDEIAVEPMRFASDEAHAEALAQLAAKVELNKGGKIKVTPPTSHIGHLKPRTLKTFQGGVSAIAVYAGMQQKHSTPRQAGPLMNAPPPSSQGDSTSASAAPVAYSNVELEQRAWEILTQALNTSDAPELVDFRKRHGVGADGAIDWTTFVELKASGRALQSSIEMSNAQFERAKERGADYILALVCGLEDGERTEARLILDPAHRATVRPIRGVRLIGLAEAPAIVLHFGDQDEVDVR